MLHNSIPTVIDTQNNATTLEDRIKAASMVEVLREGLFGAYHYKVADYEFEQINIGTGHRTRHFWVMRKNGKEVNIKYKYIFNLTMRKLGFIS